MMIYKDGKPYRLFRPEWEKVPKTVKPEESFNPYSLFSRSPDAARILTRILNNQDIRQSAKLVMLTLLLSARPNGKVYMPYKDLARETAISHRHISSIVGQLELKGLIKKTRNPKAKKKFRGTVYEFVLK